MSCKQFQADLPKAVNEFLEFVAHFSRSFISSNRNVHAEASKLLYQEASKLLRQPGGHFSEVHSALLFSIA